MTEDEWNTCTDPIKLLSFAETRLTERQLRLIGCACCRRIGHLLGPESEEAVSATEQYADNHLLADRLYHFCEFAHAAESEIGDPNRLAAACAATCVSADHVQIEDTLLYALDAMAGDNQPTSPEAAEQSNIVRDIAGNPFRPQLDLASLQTSPIVELARAIDRRQAFHRLPELAAVLERAGCQDEELLGHCRQVGTHVKGCWVIELLARDPVEEWGRLADTKAKLQYLRLHGRASNRKLRLFGAACCRRSWSLFRHAVGQEAVIVAEQYADDEPEGASRAQMEREVEVLFRDYWDRHGPVITREFRKTVAAELAALYVVGINPLFAAFESLGIATASQWSDADLRASEAEAEAKLLTEIFGEPFRKVSTPASWPSKVVRLAKAVYCGDPCSFALHDALEEAGHLELANHFKAVPWHPKGCWVVDLILGKT